MFLPQIYAAIKRVYAICFADAFVRAFALMTSNNESTRAIEHLLALKSRKFFYSVALFLFNFHKLIALMHSNKVNLLSYTKCLFKFAEVYLNSFYDLHIYQNAIFIA